MEVMFDQYIGKKYRLKSSENFDEYLKYIGVGLISRKLATAVTPISVLTRQDNVYTLTMTTSVRTIVFSFKFDEEFIEERPDGCKLKSTVTLNKGDMIHTQIESNGRKSVHTRSFTPDKLTVISKAEGWNGTCTRVYEAIE